MGVSQARVSRIEHGQIGDPDTLRTYVTPLSGTLEMVADVGDHTVKVA